MLVSSKVVKLCSISAELSNFKRSFDKLDFVLNSSIIIDATKSNVFNFKKRLL